jgi:magnesium chelatase family protein
VDALRQPLEEGRVEIMRGQRTLEFPANAIVLAACNRCPCARPPDDCACTSLEQGRYQRRLSGPLLDRIDLLVTVARPGAAALTDAPLTSTATVRQRVLAARERRQLERGTVPRDRRAPAPAPAPRWYRGAL